MFRASNEAFRTPYLTEFCIPVTPRLARGMAIFRPILSLLATQKSRNENFEFPILPAQPAWDLAKLRPKQRCRLRLSVFGHFLGVKNRYFQNFPKNDGVKENFKQPKIKAWESPICPYVQFPCNHLPGPRNGVFQSILGAIFGPKKMKCHKKNSIFLSKNPLFCSVLKFVESSFYSEFAIWNFVCFSPAHCHAHPGKLSLAT